MAWTTPRTWTVGMTPTAAMFNTDIRDNSNWLRAFHGCRLYKSSPQTITAGNTDVVGFGVEDFDTDGFHSTSTNTSRITIPSGYDGYWHFVFEADVDADAANHNTFTPKLRKNAAGSDASGTLLQSTRVTGHTNPQTGLVQVTIPLVATDYVEAFFASAGENRDLQSGVAGTVFTAFYLGS